MIDDRDLSNMSLLEIWQRAKPRREAKARARRARVLANLIIYVPLGVIGFAFCLPFLAGVARVILWLNDLEATWSAKLLGW